MKNKKIMRVAALLLVCAMWTLIMFTSCETFPNNLPAAGTPKSTAEKKPADKANEKTELAQIAEEQGTPGWTEPEFSAVEPEFRLPTPPEPSARREPPAPPAAPPEPEAAAPVEQAIAPPAPTLPAPPSATPPSAAPQTDAAIVKPPPSPPKTVRPAERAPRPVAAPTPPPVRSAEKPPASPPLFSEAPVSQTPALAATLPARPAAVETVAPQKQISRSVRAVVGQILEVPFRGSGWVYLGERDSKRGISYDSRRLDSEGQTFVFRVEHPGEYHLEFSKQDFVKNTFIQDVVELTASEAPPRNTPRLPGENDRIIAEPRWPVAGGGGQLALSNSGKDAGSARAETPLGGGAAETQDALNGGALETGGAAIEREALGSNIASLPATQNAVPVPQDYLAKARNSAAAGKFPDAVKALDSLRDENPEISDEAWWLYGQSFESNSEVRDIKAAADAYGHIVREFPQSRYFNNARGRLSYLNRFYFNIR